MSVIHSKCQQCGQEVTRLACDACQRDVPLDDASVRKSAGHAGWWSVTFDAGIAPVHACSVQCLRQLVDKHGEAAAAFKRGVFLTS